MDPGEPLAAAADRPSGEESGRERQQPERGSTRADDERHAHGDASDGYSGRRSLPVDGEAGEERVAGR